MRRAARLEGAADRAGVPRPVLCLAFAVLRPLLEEELAATARWRWVSRAGYRAVVRLLRAYEERNCPGGAR